MSNNERHGIDAFFEWKPPNGEYIISVVRVHDAFIVTTPLAVYRVSDAQNTTADWQIEKVRWI